MDRKFKFHGLKSMHNLHAHIANSFLFFSCLLSSYLFWLNFSEHTRDKQIQRDDEYYDGDNDNDRNMDDV